MTVAKLSEHELRDRIKATLSETKVDKLTALLCETRFYLPDLIDLSFNDDRKIAFRAAWLLENVLLERSVDHINHLPYLISRFHDVINESCMRHYAKIATYLTSAKVADVVKNKVAEIDTEPVVNKCFDWLIDPKVMVAVKAFAADALFNLRTRYPWIADELKEQLHHLMKNGSAAIQIRGKKLLAWL